jgi:hypothetical protein
VSITEIHARLEVMTQVAKERMRMCAADFACVVGGAEIDFMTPDERAKRHALVMMLPTSFEEAQAAKARIQARIAQRKTRHAQAAVV